MSAQTQTRTTRPTATGSWVSVHRAATLIVAVLVVAAVVLAVTLLTSRDSASDPAPSIPAPELTGDLTNHDCGTISEPVPC